MSVEEIRQEQNRLWKEYDKLQLPKPDYFEWAAQASRREQFNEVHLTFMTAKSPSDRIRALTLLMEFSKSKPKQQLEVSSGDEANAAPITPEEIIRLAFGELNLDFDKFLEWAGAKPKETVN